MYEEDDWIIEGADDYCQFEADRLEFKPSRNTNLLGHPSEWGAALTDSQCKALASIADEDGGSLRMEWGCFICPCKLWVEEKLLVVNTSATW